MNRVILQRWEESSVDEFISDGCSIHIDESEHSRYIGMIYSSRSESIPERYDRVVGDKVYICVIEDFYKIVDREGTVRIGEDSLTNLLNLEEIIGEL